MNLILVLVASCLWMTVAWDCRNLYIQLPSFKIFRKTTVKRKSTREFKTFKFKKTNHGIIVYEETKYRVI